MGDIFKPIEKKPWIGWFALICYCAVLAGVFLHYKILAYLAVFALVLVCAEIAEMQMKIMKDHIGRLEERVDKLESATGIISNGVTPEATL